MRPTPRLAALAAVLALTGGLVLAQRFGGGEMPAGQDYKTAREAESHSTGTPNWTNDAHFARDVFTFTRVKYSSGGGRRSRGGWGDHRWKIDFPDSDLNLSYRVQQMTSIKVDPDGRVVKLTDKELADYPWIYIVEPGELHFTDEEVLALRRYLLNGGFLMVDDFWGEVQYANFHREMRRVFPDREAEELPMDHAIFNCVFPLGKYPKNKLQVPNVGTGMRSQYDGVTWEYHDGEECRDPHFKGIHDDKGRMMVFIAHNTDNGDGWEREGEYEYFFKNFSEKIAFPLGINVIFYAMTH